MVVMAALCFSMTEPVSANALACRHIVGRKIVSEWWDESEVGEHKFYLPYVNEETGKTEMAKIICEIITIHQMVEYGCLCGALRDPAVHETDVVHTALSCPDR